MRPLVGFNEGADDGSGVTSGKVILETSVTLEKMTYSCKDCKKLFRDCSDAKGRPASCSALISAFGATYSKVWSYVI